MRRRDVEDRVRQMRWPEPSATLRTRVLEGSADALMQRPAARISGARNVETVAYAGDVIASRHGWRRLGIATAVTLLVIAAACAGFDVVEGHRVEVEVARFEARYGSLAEKPLMAPAVPAADNRALVVREALGLVVGIPGQTYHSIDFNLPGPVPADLRAFAQANHDAIRVAGDVRYRAQSSWDTDYRHDMLPHQPIRILSNAVFLDALLQLEAGRADDATKDVLTGLTIAASLRAEPSMFVQFLRYFDVTRRQLQAIREVISQSEPSPGLLRELAALMAEDRVAEPMLAVMVQEAKAVDAVFARMENGDIDPNVVSYIYPETWPSWPSKLVPAAARIGRPFVREARVRFLRYMGDLLDVLASPRPHPALPQYPEPQRWQLIDRLTDKFAGGAAHEASLPDNYLSAFGATQVAVALRRYRQDLGMYPPDLSALVPRYLDSLPINPFTGRPPVYARQGAGFTLHAQSPIPPKYVAQSGLVLDWDVSR